MAYISHPIDKSIKSKIHKLLFDHIQGVEIFSTKSGGVNGHVVLD